MDFEKRHQRLSEKIAPKTEIDCIAIISAPNLRYFFNYSGESFERFCCGLLSKDGSKSALIVPRLDIAKAENSNAQKVYSWTDSEGYASALSSAAKEMGVRGKVIGSELSITLGQMDNFKTVLGTSNFVAISDEISSLRLIKDEAEIASIRKAARILERVYNAIPEFLRAGKRELEVGLEIRRFLAEHGAEKTDFCAVQSGRNGAIPHSEVTPKKLERGELVVIDISCTNREGYFADFTRTFSLGDPKEKQKEVYKIVKDSQARGCKAAGPGVLAKEVDIASRSVIAKAGYAGYFYTRVGHGLGLEVHEMPWIRDDNEQELERGMVFTVEPGIYLPGKFGVRIEDDVLIEKNRASNLTKLSHDLTIVN